MPKKSKPTKYNVGDYIIIDSNGHHPEAEGLLGKIEKAYPKEDGLRSVTIYDVKYVSGEKELHSKFSDYSIRQATKDNLIKLKERYDEALIYINLLLEEK